MTDARTYYKKTRIDNDSEFTSELFISWAKEHDIMIDYIKPDCSYQNADIERFNRTYCDDVLDCYIVNNLNEVKQIFEGWIGETTTKYRTIQSMT